MGPESKLLIDKRFSGAAEPQDQIIVRPNPCVRRTMSERPPKSAIRPARAARRTFMSTGVTPFPSPSARRAAPSAVAAAEPAAHVLSPRRPEAERDGPVKPRTARREALSRA